jgi:hypothetical protein
MECDLDRVDIPELLCAAIPDWALSVMWVRCS